MSNVVSLITELIKEQSVNTVSFDVFDTLVFRRLGHPVDVFAKAYLHCMASLNLTMDSEEFKELRIHAEKQAKRQCFSGEVTLEEIYQNLPFEESVRQELKVAELLVERQSCFVYQPMLELIKGLIDSGKTVILISDMYLSCQQIRQHLFTDYPELQALPLYVSSEYRLNKATGTLFDHLSEKLHLDKQTWLHLGDNRNSDFLVPGKKGIHAKCLTPELDVDYIFRLEKTLFSQNQNFNSARFIAATHYLSFDDPIAFNMGSLVWGPILYAFSDWVIDQTIKAKSKCILCLMREAEVFAPLIELRLQQRNIADISVKKLYASRKSTFWPAINLQKESWFDDLIYILVQRRGYTVDDFYRDFQLTVDDMHAAYKEVLIRDTDGLFHQGKNLLKQLSGEARANIKRVRTYIEQQKTLFVRYYECHIGEAFDSCTVLDLGGGGTIQHHIESIFYSKSAANLLFYSSERIYRFAEHSHYTSFIHGGNDEQNLRQILARSPECIEPFLVGDCGTTLGYNNDVSASPIIAEQLSENTVPVISFLQGVSCYFSVHHKLGFDRIEAKQVVPILFRYVQLPTKSEAEIFRHVLHQDNFGSNDAYPIISDKQIIEIDTFGLKNFYQEFCQYPRIKLGKIHWPQAVITLLSERFLARQAGAMLMDTDSDVLNLVERLLDEKWTYFSVYGAGLFFEKLLPYLHKNNLKIEYLIDRKAEISGQYQVAGYDVIPLDAALQKGCQRILISSFAFKDEIARNIYEQSVFGDTPVQYSHSVEILSL